MSIYKNDKGITTLIVVFLIGFMGLGMALTITTIALLGINKNYNTTSGNQSFYTAEAAAREGIYQYIHNPSYSGGDSPLINNAILATIDVTSTWPYVKIKGIAENNLTHREVVYNLNTFPESLAFDYAIFSASNINLGGNSSTSGNTFSNGTTTLSGSAEVNGSAFAAGNVTGDVDHITGTITTNATPIPIPQINVDFDQYKIAAENNPDELGGTFYTNATTVKDYLKNETRMGVIFASTTNPVIITGDNTKLSGSLVTKGNLTITKGKYTATNNYNIIVVAGDFEITGGEIEGNVYVEGNFKATGNGKIKGIVYVKGGTTFGAGTPIIDGALISVGGIETTLLGSAKIVYNPDILAGWADFDGISTTTASSPRIINWQEQ